MKTKRVQCACDEINKLYNSVLKDLSYDDMQLTDLDHFLEMGKLDASSRAKIQKKRYEILNHRRQIKLELADITSIRDIIKNRYNKEAIFDSDIEKYDYRTNVIADIFSGKTI